MTSFWRSPPTKSRQSRVLHVINQLHGGGAEVSLQEIVLGTRDEFAHAVALFHPPGPEGELLRRAGVAVFAPTTSLGSHVARLWHVYRAVQTFDPDLLHTTLFEAVIAGAVIGKLTRTTVLTSIVNTPPPRDAFDSVGVSHFKLKLAHIIEKGVLRYTVSQYHAITNAAAHLSGAALGLDPQRIVVVPRGRDLARLGPYSPQRGADMRNELGIGATAPVIISVGREEPQKGQIHLVNAMPELQRAWPTVRLVIAGRRGRSSRALDERISTLGLEATVLRLGLRSDVGDLLCAADVFAFPSLWEGLGGAVLEAMALERPVVASDLPALREVLDHGRCGVLVRPADSKALAEGITHVLTDATSAQDRVEAAHRRFKQNYTLSGCVQQMRQLYRGALAASMAQPKYRSHPERPLA